MCFPKKLCDKDECKICFDRTFASHEKSKYWSDKNENIKPRNIAKYSSKKFWFDCDKKECGHSFYSSIANITNLGRWCPYCSNQKLCNEEDCKRCFEKSFASHEKSKFWSDKNTNIKPRHVLKGSPKKYWFECDKKEECCHSFYISLNKISTSKRWCAFCKNKKLCEKEDCNICFEKSFASHPKSKFWSAKNENINPRDLFKNSHEKYWFDCNKCFHNFSMSLSSITSKNNWCHYCCNPPQLLCEEEECKICFERTFASQEKSKFWSAKNENIKPRDLFKGSLSKYWFDCKDCKNSFRMSLSSITSRNYWCPVCKNKTEKKLFNKLKENYPELEHQFKIEWCKNLETKRLLPYDFVLKEHKIIIELDGLQHFEQVSNWTSPEEIFKRDKYKEKCANENGYSMIRILQDDVWNDKYEWLEDMDTNIKEIIKNKTLKNIYMSKNEEYKKYI